jgi:NADH-quinone oxidoreductase subunit C
VSQTPTPPELPLAAPLEAPAPPGPPAEAADQPGPDAEVGPGPALMHGCPVAAPLGQPTVHTDQARYLALMEALYADGYESCIGVTGVDYLTHPGRDLPEGVTAERFEVVVELLSISNRLRLRVRCQVAEANPTVASLFDLWPGSEAHERETFDMYGVRFDDHPDLTRILMPEDWEGHPLRKDYATGHVPVQFKEAPE